MMFCDSITALVGALGCLHAAGLLFAMMLCFRLKLLLLLVTSALYCFLVSDADQCLSIAIVTQY